MEQLITIQHGSTNSRPQTGKSFLRVVIENTDEERIHLRTAIVQLDVDSEH